MNKEELVKKIEEIDEQIAEISYDGRSAIFDGIVDVDRYLAADLKIMWILKEVNSLNDEGEWSLTKDILLNLKDDSTTSGIKSGWDKTLPPVIYVTHGLLNQKIWKEIPDLTDDNSIADTLQDIAFINLKKVSGIGKSNDKEIKSYLKEYSSIIEKQINGYQPNVIICGGTGDFIDDILDEILGNYVEKNIENNIKFFFYKDVVLVYAYHPNLVVSYRKKDQETYCDTIIKNVLAWKGKYIK